MTTNAISPPNTSRVDIAQHIFAGACASLVAIGLARFAYTPLLPALIQAHWFSASDAAYLGAANLAGYLIGALVGRPLASRLTNEHTLRLMMLIVTAAFFACAFPVSVNWFFVWRLASGVSGGTIMVLVAATVLPHVPLARRHLASGAIFLGIGFGVAASGTMVPLLLNMGLRDTWIGLGLLSAMLSAASWFCWPSSSLTRVAPVLVTSIGPAAKFSRGVYILYIQYALIAVGLVPVMVFLVDFIVRGLGATPRTGSLYWSLYGIGAIAGPPLYGYFADRVGPRPTLRVVLAIEVLATLGLYVATDRPLIAVLTVIVGTLPPGIVPLVLARIHELIPHDAHKQNIGWSRATTVFAAFQALSGYAYSAVYSASDGNHRLLFLVGGISLLVALSLEAVSRTAFGNRR